MQSASSVPLDAVSCSHATTTQSGDGMAVTLTAPKELFGEMIDILTKREHHKLPDFYKKYKANDKVQITLLKLTYLLEYCRMRRRAKLYIAPERSEQGMPTLLQLDELVGTPKFCFAEGCTSKQNVLSCEKCVICWWCSEECRTKSFDDHTVTLCAHAQKYRQDLGL